MTAKEMFEALGFKRQEDNFDIWYSKDEKNRYVTGQQLLRFHKCDSIYYAVWQIENKNANNVKPNPLFINNNLYQAIHQQMKELGWI